MSTAAPCRGVEILGQEAFIEIADEWDSLLQRSYDNRLFFTPAWHRLWWDHFGAGPPYVLTLRDPDCRLQGVVTLQIDVRGADRVLTLLGDFNVADYMDGVAEKKDALPHLRTLWEVALAELDWTAAELRHVPASSPLIPALQAAAEGRLAVTVASDEVCPVAILCSSWEGYLQMLTKKQRHEIRRKLRRAQDEAEWHWRTVRDEAGLERDLPVFFQLHEASAREKERFMTPAMRGYFGDLARELLSRDWLRLSVFQRDGVDIAAVMAFVYRGRYLLFNSGYDPAYAACSPGIAAVALTMQDAIAEKAVAFDFLSGNEPYKYQFGAANTYTSRVDVTRS
jgi:CelD/BcsL family acetyltransferase involved in cellulose biosynthesis